MQQHQTEKGGSPKKKNISDEEIDTAFEVCCKIIDDPPEEYRFISFIYFELSFFLLNMIL